MRSAGHRRPYPTNLSCGAVVLALLVGCVGYVEDEPEVPSTLPFDQEVPPRAEPPMEEPPPPDDPTTPPPDDIECGTSVVTLVADILSANCAQCHSETTRQGGAWTITDAESLIAHGVVVPHVPDMSPMYTRVVTGTMPPLRGAQLGAGEVEAIYTWIACGAEPFGS